MQKFILMLATLLATSFTYGQESNNNKPSKVLRKSEVIKAPKNLKEGFNGPYITKSGVEIEVKAKGGNITSVTFKDVKGKVLGNGIAPENLVVAKKITCFNCCTITYPDGRSVRRCYEVNCSRPHDEEWITNKQSITH